MKQNNNFNTATFVGIDAHPTTHTALAINRFEEEKGMFTFDNTKEGISRFLCWLPIIDSRQDNIFVGIEGGGNSRHGLIANPDFPKLVPRQKSFPQLFNFFRQPLFHYDDFSSE